MDMKEIFSKALGIEQPWFVSDINFDVQAKRLDIQIDFIKGSTFPFDQDGVVGQYKAYDTINKAGRLRRQLVNTPNIEALKNAFLLTMAL